MDINSETWDTKGVIEAALDKVRPDRYSPRDFEWADDVVAAVAAVMPTEKAVHLYAEKICKGVEQTRTQKTNEFLRVILELGGLPSGYAEMTSLPVATRPKKERVRFGALTADDLQEFAINERRAAMREAVKREEACSGAELLSERMIEAGAKTLEEYGRMIYGDDE